MSTEPTDAEVVAQLRKLLKELDRMDRSEDYRIRIQLFAILAGEDPWNRTHIEAEATRREVNAEVFGKGSDG